MALLRLPRPRPSLATSSHHRLTVYTEWSGSLTAPQKPTQSKLDGPPVVSILGSPTGSVNEPAVETVLETPAGYANGPVAETILETPAGYANAPAVGSVSETPAGAVTH
jgi:hypothetical protein